MKIPILIDAERRREGLDDLLNLASYVVCSEKFPQASNRPLTMTGPWSQTALNLGSRVYPSCNHMGFFPSGVDWSTIDPQRAPINAS